MPTESNEFGPGKLLYKDQEEIIKELCSYEFKEENSDDAVDALRYDIELQTKKVSSITISKESPRSLQKISGIEKITRKRFIKLLMGCRIQRNEAEEIAKAVYKSQIAYSPIVVQAILEWIIKEKLKEEEQ